MKEIKDKDFNRIKKTIEQLYDYHAAVDDLESMRDCEEETVFSEITLKLKKIVNLMDKMENSGNPVGFKCD